MIIYKNYLEYYENKISAVLKEIDICLACEENISVEKLSNLLCITDYEVSQFCRNSEAMSFEILHILRNSSSYLSEMLRREMQVNKSGIYTKEELAYIYGIDLKMLDSIFRTLNLKTVKEKDLSRVFSRIQF